jgi:hypothetical protein
MVPFTQKIVNKLSKKRGLGIRYPKKTYGSRDQKRHRIPDPQTRVYDAHPGGSLDDGRYDGGGFRCRLQVGPQVFSQSAQPDRREEIDRKPEKKKCKLIANLTKKGKLIANLTTKEVKCSEKHNLRRMWLSMTQQVFRVCIH